MWPWHRPVRREKPRAVKDWHIQIQEDGAGVMVAHLLQRLSPVGGSHHCVVLDGQDSADEVAN